MQLLGIHYDLHGEVIKDAGCLQPTTVNLVKRPQKLGDVVSILMHTLSLGGTPFVEPDDSGEGCVPSFCRKMNVFRVDVSILRAGPLLRHGPQAARARHAEHRRVQPPLEEAPTPARCTKPFANICRMVSNMSLGQNISSLMWI